MSELIGAGHGEGTEEAMHRNGYMARRWDREIQLQTPKILRGSYFPTFLQPRKRSEQALVRVKWTPSCGNLGAFAASRSPC